MAAHMISSLGALFRNQFQDFYEYMHCTGLSANAKPFIMKHLHHEQPSKRPKNHRSCIPLKEIKQEFRKTELCRAWEEGRECIYESRPGGCAYAHGEHELRRWRINEKRRLPELCHSYHRDLVCCYGERCCYIHEIDTRSYQGGSRCESRSGSSDSFLSALHCDDEIDCFSDTNLAVTRHATPKADEIDLYCYETLGDDNNNEDSATSVKESIISNDKDAYLEILELINSYLLSGDIHLNSSCTPQAHWASSSCHEQDTNIARLPPGLYTPEEMESFEDQAQLMQDIAAVVLDA